jgi:Co/Zn/Cd efflux system component
MCSRSASPPALNALSRRYANDTRFAFGTWKIEVLGGFTSAILLGGVALFMALESIERLFHPVAILFDQAIVVAVIGLAVNVISALLLREIMIITMDTPTVMLTPTSICERHTCM